MQNYDVDADFLSLDQIFDIINYQIDKSSKPYLYCSVKYVYHGDSMLMLNEVKP